MNRRVVVTGAGVVTPLGIGLDKTWEALTAGQSGVDLITRFDTSDYSIGCIPVGFADGSGFPGYGSFDPVIYDFDWEYGGGNYEETVEDDEPDECTFPGCDPGAADP